MTQEMLLIAAVRIAGSLPVLRWPFFGGLLALIVDQGDLLIMNLVDLGGVDDYQSFDKYLDQVYLATFLIVALRWDGAPRTIAVVLYLFRFAGFIAFEATGERDLLLFFPNLFEFWFLFVAGYKQFRRAPSLTTVSTADGQTSRLPRKDSGSSLWHDEVDPPLGVTGPVLALLLAAKLFQEYAIHYARWLDSFTTVEAIEAAWVWLTGPFS